MNRLNDEQKKFLKNEGYLLIENIIPQYSIERALRAINIEIGEGGLPQDIFNWGMNCKSAQSEDVMSLLYHTPLWLVCHELIKDPRPQGCQVALRYPSFHPREGLHLDGLYEDDEELDSFTAIIGIPLTDVSKPDSGELLVFPRSQDYVRNIYHGTDVYFKDKSPAKRITDYAKLIRDDTLSRVCMNVGDAIILNSFVLHEPASNFSPNVRYAVYFRIRAEKHEKGWVSIDKVWGDWHE